MVPLTALASAHSKALQQMLTLCAAAVEALISDGRCIAISG